MTFFVLIALTHASMEEIEFVPDFASITMRQALRLHNKRVTLLIATEDPDNEDERPNAWAMTGRRGRSVSGGAGRRHQGG